MHNSSNSIRCPGPGVMLIYKFDCIKSSVSPLFASPAHATYCSYLPCTVFAFAALFLRFVPYLVPALTCLFGRALPSYIAQSCPALPCPALPCPALPCPALPASFGPALPVLLACSFVPFICQLVPWLGILVFRYKNAFLSLPAI